MRAVVTQVFLAPGPRDELSLGQYPGRMGQEILEQLELLDGEFDGPAARFTLKASGSTSNSPNRAWPSRC